MLISAPVLIARLWRDRKHWDREARNGSAYAKAVVKGIDIVRQHVRAMVEERRRAGMI